MGFLQNKNAYLSGPIEHQAKQQPPRNLSFFLGPNLYVDTGVVVQEKVRTLETHELNWRLPVVETLESRFRIDVFDPHADPKQQWAPELIKAREEKNFLKMVEIAGKFVQKDLSKVDRSDFLVANLPYQVPTAGTHHEIIVASNLKKPTLLVCEQGREYLPLWYYGFIPLDFMFDSWDGLYSYLDEVDKGLHKHNKKWSYVYGLI